MSSTRREKPQAFQVLLEKIEEHREHIDCGVLGARVLFHMLSDFGEVDPGLPGDDSAGRAPSATGLPRRPALAEDFYTEEQGVNSRNHHFFRRHQRLVYQGAVRHPAQPGV